MQSGADILEAVSNLALPMRRGVLAVVLSLPVFGCAAMLGEPLPTEADSHVDPEIVGTWNIEDVDVSVNSGDRIKKDSRFDIGVEGNHHVIRPLADKDGDQFDAYASVIGDGRYISINIKSIVDAEVARELGGRQQIAYEKSLSSGLFIVFAYDLDGDEMSARGVELGEILEAVDDEDIAGDIDRGCDLELDRLGDARGADEDDRDGLEFADKLLGMGFICKTVWADPDDLIAYIRKEGVVLSDDEKIRLKRVQPEME